MSSTATQDPVAVRTARTAREWVDGFTEGWRAPAGADGFIAHFREMLADDIRLIQPQLGTTVGRSAFEEQFVRPLFDLMPDLRADVERWAVNGDEIFLEITLHGTLGRRAVAWRACDRVTLRAGVAIERETYFDPTPLLRAIARTPRAWPRFIWLQARTRAATTRRAR
jgi:SnoaL-like domain